MTRRPESVLAIDTGMATGWAFHDRAGMVTGTKVFPSGLEPGHLFSLFNIWMADQIIDMRPELVVYEDQTGHSQRANGMKIRLGMQAGVLLTAWRHERVCLPLYSGTIKKHATGNGRAGKPDMIDAARAMGWRIATDHEADAAWMAHYAITTLNIEKEES